MNPPLQALLAAAVRHEGAAGEAARGVALEAAEHGHVSGDEGAARAQLGAWLDDPAANRCVFSGVPGAGTTTLLARWLPEAAARGFTIVWVPLHRVAGLSAERAALALLSAALEEIEPRLRGARHPDAIWRWCVCALEYDRDPADGEPPLLVVIDGVHEAAGWRAMDRIQSIMPGAHVRLLWADHGPAQDAGAHSIALGGASPGGMREALARAVATPAHRVDGARVQVLRALASAPHPVDEGVLRAFAPGGDPAGWLGETPVCLPEGGGRWRLSHGAYRALLSELDGPWEEEQTRAELGRACLAELRTDDRPTVRALLADLVGARWPTLEGAARLLEPGWVRARIDAPGGLFDALVDVRRARAAAIGALGSTGGEALYEEGATAPEDVTTALRLVAESATWEAVLASLAGHEAPWRAAPLRFEDAAPLARSLLSAHAHGAHSTPAPPLPEAPAEGESTLSLEVLRERLSGDLSEGERGRCVAALVRAGHEDEARAAIAPPGSIPFSRAWVTLVAAALSGDAALEHAARAEIDVLPRELLPVLVSVAPGAACAVVGVERALELASCGVAYRQLNAFSALLPHLPADTDRVRAAAGAFEAWDSLPQDHDAAGAIVPVLAWLPRAAAVTVLDRLLASSARFTVDDLLSPDEPGGLPSQLPVFRRLGGAPGAAAAWGALATVARALSGG